MLAYANRLSLHLDRRPQLAINVSAPYADRGDRMVADAERTCAALAHTDRPGGRRCPRRERAAGGLRLRQLIRPRHVRPDQPGGPAGPGARVRGMFQPHDENAKGAKGGPAKGGAAAPKDDTKPGTKSAPLKLTPDSALRQ